MNKSVCCDAKAFLMSGLAAHLVNGKSCGFDAGILHAMCSQDSFKSQRTQQKTYCNIKVEN